MQPTIQQSQIVHHRVATPSAHRCNTQKVAHPSGSRPAQGTRSPSPLPVDLARALIALLPGRAALLDTCGLVIAWNDQPSPESEYEHPPLAEDLGLVVTPLRNTGGVTLVWAPQTQRRPELVKKTSHALNASRAQISDLTSRLMHAQEDERKKIARELHDDLGQRLAAHAFAIGNLKQQPPGCPELLKERLLCLEAGAIELGEAIRMVSHELHPALLERHGLADALHAFASEFCEWAGLRLVADIQKPPTPLPHSIALTAYRIVQEAIRNIDRHAHATTVHLKLRFTPQQLHLVIEDDGIGFATDAPARRKGLGLTSIEERVQLLNGRVSIDGSQGRGTTLAVRIPTNLTGP